MKKKDIQKSGWLLMGGGRQTRTTCHAGQSREQLNGIFTQTKEVKNKHRKTVCEECTHQPAITAFILFSVQYASAAIVTESGHTVGPLDVIK